MAYWFIERHKVSVARFRDIFWLVGCVREALHFLQMTKRNKTGNYRSMLKQTYVWSYFFS